MAPLTRPKKGGCVKWNGKQWVRTEGFSYWDGHKWVRSKFGGNKGKGRKVSESTGKRKATLKDELEALLKMDAWSEEAKAEAKRLTERYKGTIPELLFRTGLR